jgi:hypothetical protein
MAMAMLATVLMLMTILLKNPQMVLPLLQQSLLRPSHLLLLLCRLQGVRL